MTITRLKLQRFTAFEDIDIAAHDYGILAVWTCRESREAGSLVIPSIADPETARSPVVVSRSAMHASSDTKA